jgi:voltage-gated potassium channel
MTIGSAYWPHTLQGRVLALLLAMYGFTMLGYVTGIFAKFLVQEKPGSDSVSAELAALRREIAALRTRLQRPAA